MPSCCDEQQLIPVPDALAQMQKQVRPVTETETLPLEHTLERVLAQPVTATIDVPAYDNSAMDGYALRAEDALQGSPLRLVGAALAGHPFTGEVQPGTCVRIMTGAPVPAGADAVVMQENVQLDNQTVSLKQVVKAGENIRRRGEDIRAGTTVLQAGHRLGPLEIGFLASLGVGNVEVLRRLRVAVLSTGDELTPPGQPLAPGHIYDSNRYGIIAVLQRLGVEVIDLGLIKDQRDDIASALGHAAQEADAVLSSGGVSVGDADYVKDVLDEIGEINFWKVAMKPGKPFAFGSLGNAWFFGLPGNPVSALVTLHQLALPILRTLSGEVFEPPRMLSIPAGTSFKKRPGRRDYQRACLSLNNGENSVTSAGAQGSGMLTSFLKADCYAVLEQDSGNVEAGDLVNVLPFDRFIAG